MQDSQIVDLYWARSENAITVTNDKYGSYCRKIAMNITASSEDTEECVNDTYLSAWNSMPEERPHMLAPFLAAITRNHAITLYRKSHSAKRGSGQTALALDELAEVAGISSVEDEAAHRQLARLINDFLGEQSEAVRIVFVRRYFYVDSLADIAGAMKMSEAGVKSQLFRIRQKLKEYLEKEGYEL